MGIKVLSALFFILYFNHVGKRGLKKMKNKVNLKAWIFTIPSLILIVSFVFYPMIQAFITSFYTGVANNLSFGGLANYQRLLTDTTFQKALFNTLLFLVIQVPIMIILASVLRIWALICPLKS